MIYVKLPRNLHAMLISLMMLAMFDLLGNLSNVNLFSNVDFLEVILIYVQCIKTFMSQALYKFVVLLL